MSAANEMVGQVWKAMRRTPRLFAVVLTFVLRSPRLVLEAGGRVEHRDRMAEHLQSVWAGLESELRYAAGEGSVTVPGHSGR